jgi:hypothetical protein
MTIAEIILLRKKIQERDQKIQELEQELSYHKSQTRTIRGLVTHKDGKVGGAQVQIKVIGKQLSFRKRTDRLGMFFCSFKAIEIEEDDEIEITVSKTGFKPCCETISMATVKSKEFKLTI